MEISSKKGKTFSGTVTWPNFKTSTKMEGTINGNDVRFQETEFLIGDGVIVPMEYVGTISEEINSKQKKDEFILSGDYSGEGAKGEFNIKIV